MMISFVLCGLWINNVDHMWRNVDVQRSCVQIKLGCISMSCCDMLNIGSDCRDVLFNARNYGTLIIKSLC